MRLGPTPALRACLQRPLATDTVRYVGEPVAVVVAASRYLAEDALELIAVDYTPLPVVPVRHTDARALALEAAAFLARSREEPARPAGVGEPA